MSLTKGTIGRVKLVWRVRAVLRKILSFLVLFTFASEASACNVVSSFFQESSNDTIIACLQSEEFFSSRDIDHLTVLHLAVEANRDRVVLDAVRRAAGDGWTDLMERVNRDGRTALHLATETANPADIVRWLLNWGAKPNAMYGVEGRWNPALWDYGFTSLHLAAARSDGADAVSALLLSGADPEIPRPPTKEGWTAALIASRHAEDLRVLTALAAGGADMEAVAQDSNNSLHIAAAWDRPTSVIRFLLESGVDPDDKNDEGQTALHLAARFASNPEAVEFLLEASDDPCAADPRERTARKFLETNAELAGEVALERQFHEICIEGN